jgi:uncharacterized protein (AIM24 family)
MKALELGGNAIVAADIDYAEVGGLKGMLMVAATGTAVMLNNLDVLGAKNIEIINNLQGSIERLRLIEGLR